MSHDTQVLLLDDDDAVHRFFQDAATRCNIQVTSAHCGREGLAACERMYYSLIIIATTLSDMDGLAALLALQKIAPQSRYIMMTNTPVDAVLRKAIAAGAAGTLFKPPDLDQVMAAVQKSEVVRYFAEALENALYRSGGRTTKESRKAKQGLQHAEQLECSDAQHTTPKT
jgi:ActR/RegA family two-component response regulator